MQSFIFHGRIGALKSKVDKLSQVALQELSGFFGTAIPRSLFMQDPWRIQRRRAFSRQVTFWGMLSQVFSSSSSCRGALQRIQALRVSIRTSLVSTSTSAYCKARKRLSSRILHRIRHRIACQLEERTLPSQLWLGRKVRVVDSTSSWMPDTSVNQVRYPQPSEQKKGCGFPVVKICALFSLATGAVIAATKSSLHIHDGRLFRRLWRFLSSGDVILGDRAFCSFANIFLLQGRGIDVVFRLHQARLVDFRKGRRLAKNDRIIHWEKPPQRTKTMSKLEFESFPDQMLLREIKFTICARGFRTKCIFLVTTLLDPKAFPVAALAELFRDRWMIELCFRDIKITMGMEQLKCQSPQMIAKEIQVYLIGYNLVRTLMFDSAKTHNVSLELLSFKGTIHLILQ